MKNWAIIVSGGKQYKVEEGQTIDVEKLPQEKNSQITFNNVLAIGGEAVKIGNPQVAGANVKAKVLENFRDKKIRVVKFKSKSRYTRTRGHRHEKTKVIIEKIQI